MLAWLSVGCHRSISALERLHQGMEPPRDLLSTSSSEVLRRFRYHSLPRLFERSPSHDSHERPGGLRQIGLVRRWQRRHPEISWLIFSQAFCLTFPSFLSSTSRSVLPCSERLPTSNLRATDTTQRCACNLMLALAPCCSADCVMQASQHHLLRRDEPALPPVRDAWRRRAMHVHRQKCSCRRDSRC